MSAPLRGSVAIVGAADTAVGRLPDRTPVSVAAEASVKALADAGLSTKDVDALFGTFAFGAVHMPTAVLAEYLGIRPMYVDSSAMGGSSFLSHVGHAVLAITAGVCEVALIAYGSTQLSRRRRDPRGPWGYDEPTAPYEILYDIPLPVGGYALAAQRHMYQYGTTSRQLAELPVAARKWAALNPAAYRREPLTIDDVLASPLLADPLHVLDVCLLTDGGGAIVLTSAARARHLQRPPVYVLGFGEHQVNFGISQMPDLTETAAVLSGKRAFAMAGMTPADIDVAELYDSFTITVLLALEDLGFCKKGEGGAFLTGQRTAPGGPFPLNTSGGGLAYCHPGMFGMFLMTEAVQQIRGTAGDRQVAGVETAVTHAVGGYLSTHATLVLGGESTL